MAMMGLRLKAQTTRTIHLEPLRSLEGTGYVIFTGYVQLMFISPISGPFAHRLTVGSRALASFVSTQRNVAPQSTFQSFHPSLPPSLISIPPRTFPFRLPVVTPHQTTWVDDDTRVCLLQSQDRLW